MSEKEKLEKELEEFRKNFGLTAEEIEGFNEFYKEKPKSNRILNSGGSKPK